jgi:hypothetical protein
MFLKPNYLIEGSVLSIIKKFITKSHYEFVGAILLAGGLLLSLASLLFLVNTTITVLGFSCLILGLTTLLIPENLVPSNVTIAIIESAIINIEHILNQFDAEEKATYIKCENDEVYAYIPIKKSEVHASDLLSNSLITLNQIMDFLAPRAFDRTPEDSIKSKKIDDYNKVIININSEDEGLMILPPLSEAVTSDLTNRYLKLEDALSYLMVDYFEIVNSIKTINSGEKLILRIENPKVKINSPRYNEVFGSFTTSVAGCIISKFLSKPVQFLEESSKNDIITASFKVQLDG